MRALPACGAVLACALLAASAATLGTSPRAALVRARLGGAAVLFALAYAAQTPAALAALAALSAAVERARRARRGRTLPA